MRSAQDPRGLQVVKDLVKNADVMIENFAPGAIERLGLGYDVVKAINPGIIYAQVKGFGEGSPFEKNLAFDMIAQACGGTFSVTGPSRVGTMIFAPRAASSCSEKETMDSSDLPVTGLTAQL